MVGNFRYIILSLLFSCSSVVQINDDYKDASVNDTSNDISVCIDALSLDANSLDIKPEEKYNICYAKEVLNTKYDCLEEHICKDNYGEIKIEQLKDKCLNVYCDWNTSTDNIKRCLPATWQGGWIYADDQCLIQVGISSNSNPKYIGIADINDKALIPNKLFIYDAKGKFESVNKYRKYYDGITMNCLWSPLPVFLTNMNVALYYAGDEIDPAIFVEQ